MAALVWNFLRGIYDFGAWTWTNTTAAVQLATVSAGTAMTSAGTELELLAGSYVFPNTGGCFWTFIGCTPDPFRQSYLGATGLKISQSIRQMAADAINFIKFVAKLIGIILITIGNLLILLYPTFFWGAIVLFGLYLMQEFWPLVYSLLIHVGVPLLNVAIEVFNLVFWFVIVIYFIISVTWNLFVPFVGMFIFLLNDLFGNILQEIFSVLGNNQIMSFFQELNQITNCLVQMALQIIAVFIKVGEAELQFVVKIIGFILTIVLQFIRIIMDILTWVFKFLFPILKPILYTVQVIVYALAWLFGGIQGARSSRSLLSVGYSVAMVMSGIEDPLAEDPADSIPHIVPESQYDFFDMIHDELQSILYEQHSIYPSDLEKQLIEEELARRKFEQTTYMRSPAGEFDSQPNSRNLFATSFSEKPSLTEGGVGSMFGETLTNNIKGMKTQPMGKIAQESLERIVVYPTIQNPYSAESILVAYLKQNPDAVRLPRGANTVDHGYGVEHPLIMEKRLKKEQSEFLKSKNIPEGYSMEMAGSSGNINQWGKRKLMERSGEFVWNPEQLKHVEAYNDMVKEHETILKKQHNEYMDQQMTRMKIVDKSYAIFNDVMVKHTEGFLQLDNIKFHIDSALEHWGYKSVSEVYDHFLEHNPNAQALNENIGKIGDHWVFRSLARFDPRADSNAFFHDWSETQKLHRRRRPLDVGTASDSHEKGGDFPIMSAYNCYTHPRHPLCLPQLGLQPLFTIPFIKLPANIFNANSYVCAPWVTSGCVIFCWERLWNFLQSIRFLISVWPPINRFLTIYTIILPSMRWTVDWVFLVPKGALGTLHEWLCFVGHLYDPTIILVFLWLVSIFLLPLFSFLVLDTISYIITSRQNYEAIRDEWQSFDPTDSPYYKQFVEVQERTARRRVRNDQRRDRQSIGTRMELSHHQVLNMHGNSLRRRNVQPQGNASSNSSTVPHSISSSYHIAAPISTQRIGSSININQTQTQTHDQPTQGRPGFWQRLRKAYRPLHRFRDQNKKYLKDRKQHSQNMVQHINHSIQEFFDDFIPEDQDSHDEDSLNEVLDTLLGYLDNRYHFSPHTEEDEYTSTILNNLINHASSQQHIFQRYRGGL